MTAYPNVQFGFGQINLLTMRKCFLLVLASLMSLALCQANPIVFPSGYIPFDSLEYMTYSDQNGLGSYLEGRIALAICGTISNHYRRSAEINNTRMVRLSLHRACSSRTSWFRRPLKDMGISVTLEGLSTIHMLAQFLARQLSLQGTMA
jgi:hypothetical protein